MGMFPKAAANNRTDAHAARAVTPFGSIFPFASITAEERGLFFLQHKWETKFTLVSYPTTAFYLLL